MNRRGFLGALAGAIAGLVFRRELVGAPRAFPPAATLAAPPPTPVVLDTAQSFMHEAIALLDWELDERGLGLARRKQEGSEFPQFVDPPTARLGYAVNLRRPPVFRPDYNLGFTSEPILDKLQTVILDHQAGINIDVPHDLLKDFESCREMYLRPTMHALADEIALRVGRKRLVCAHTELPRGVNFAARAYGRGLALRTVRYHDPATAMLKLRFDVLYGRA